MSEDSPLFANEPHDPSLNYLVVIEGCNAESWGNDWVVVSEPITANEALDRTTKLHETWRRLRFTRVNDEEAKWFREQMNKK